MGWLRSWWFYLKVARHVISDTGCRGAKVGGRKKKGRGREGKSGGGFCVLDRRFTFL